MTSIRSRVPVRASAAAPAAWVDLIVALVGFVLLGYLSLATPAFTDYEVETEPAIQALIGGHLADGLRILPIYGGSILAMAPFGALARALGGGDLAVYRAVAVPGAIGVAALALAAARWLREAGVDRRTQLIAVGAVACSPCLALAWNYGHMEEALVASAAVGGVILVARGDDAATVVGGALIGLATAGKLWPVVLLPVALVSTRSRRAAVLLIVSSGVAGALLAAPIAAHHFRHVDGYAQGGAIFTRGNLWWFLGQSNPGFHEHGKVVTLFTTANSARLPPAFVSAHARQLIVVVAVALSAAWWLVQRRWAPLTVQQRVASVLLLAAAVIWWRGLADPWFQAYYLLGAVMALVLADARLGRAPTAGLVAWCAIWLIHGQNAPDMGLSADQQSAVRLLWLVPMGVYVTARALRRPA